MTIHPEGGSSNPYDPPLDPPLRCIVLCFTYVTIKIVKFVFAKLKHPSVRTVYGRYYGMYTRVRKYTRKYILSMTRVTGTPLVVFMLCLHDETLYKQCFVADHFRACDMD